MNHDQRKVRCGIRCVASLAGPIPKRAAWANERRGSLLCGTILERLGLGWFPILHGTSPTLQGYPQPSHPRAGFPCHPWIGHAQFAGCAPLIMALKPQVGGLQVGHPERCSSTAAAAAQAETIRVGHLRHAMMHLQVQHDMEALGMMRLS